MNDFTKEELEDIYDAIMDTSIAMLQHLPNKIQSMLDNYCEHEWRRGVHLFNDIYCTKCSKHFPVTNND